MCATIRSGGEEGAFARIADTPVLLLTARADEEDRLRGFESGADDYVTKPFSPEELVCRVRAILRRSNGVSNALLEIGPLQIDPRRRMVSANGQIVALTPKEFDLIHLLASSPGRVFSRESLLERVWGYSFLGNTRTVDVHVNRVRQKLAIDAQCGEMISTEWGVGYKLCAPDAADARLVALEVSA
ncbi:MAG: response regulator transcription factor [Blastochloris sp.]|nr:response regulator transcription factor [Blastochloris sp.]